MPATFQIKMRARAIDDISRIEAQLMNAVPRIRANVGRAIARAARQRAPKDTGYMASTVIDDGDGHVEVGADYGIFVNYGTRWMAAQPFFSEACAIEGVAKLQAELSRLLGVSVTIPPVDVVSQQAPFLYGPLKGVPGTFPWKSEESRMRAMRYLFASGQGVAGVGRSYSVSGRQRRRSRLGWGDAEARRRFKGMI